MQQKATRMHFIVVFMIFIITQINAQLTIKTLSPCIGELSNGKRIDITSLAAKNTFKWRQKARQPPGDPHWYYYNPCKSFSIGDMCPNNAACQTSTDEKLVYDLGRQDGTAEFQYAQDTVGILYRAADQQRSTVVYCFCAKKKEPTFQVIGQTQRYGLAIYEMALNSTCCCPDGCIGSMSGLSTGSILLIIFFCTLFAYVLFGTSYNYYKTKSLNTESIPNIEFWKEQPHNIKTGFTFVIGKFKSNNSGYSNIK